MLPITSKQATIGLIFALILALLISIGTCTYHSRNEDGFNSLNHALNAKLEVSYNKILQDSIYSKETAEISDKNLSELQSTNSQLKARLNGYTNVKTIVKEVTNTHIDTVVAYLHDSIPLAHPVDFSVSKKDYSISGTVDKKKVTFKEISFPDSSWIVIAEKKNGLFHANTLTASVNHSNAYVHVTGLDSQVISAPKKNRLLWAGIGAALTLIAFHFISH